MMFGVDNNLCLDELGSIDMDVFGDGDDFES